MEEIKSYEDAVRHDLKVRIKDVSDSIDRINKDIDSKQVALWNARAKLFSLTLRKETFEEALESLQEEPNE